tara:strand:+ start:749 stop:898 length:150 start_codon:yes stop_codon:yes gene_type:complete
MTSREFLEALCDIIGGDDAYYRFSKEELLEMCKAMSDSHQTIEDRMELR